MAERRAGYRLIDSSSRISLGYNATRVRLWAVISAQPGPKKGVTHPQLPRRSYIR